MSWAKLHTDILGDPKLMRAARKGAKGLELLPWLIAFAKQADDDGYLSVGGEPAEAADLTELIPGATQKRVQQCLDSLENIGVLARFAEELDDKVVSFLGFLRWETRSGTKPSDNPAAIGARVKAHRQRKALQDTNGVTPRNALRNAGDNATEKRREEENREEQITRSVTPAADVEPDRPPLVIPAVAPPRPKKGAVLTEDEAAVLAHYKRRHPARRPEKDPKAMRRITGALTAYSAAELCRAIDGNADDPWYREKRKHDLTYVLRDSGTIDDFLAKKAAQDEDEIPILIKDPARAYALGIVAS